MMYQSHAAYSTLGLGHALTNRMVQHIQQLSRHASHRIYGARLSGNGNGGMIVILCREDAIETIRNATKSFAHPAYKPTDIIM